MSAASRLANANTRIMPPKDPITGKFQKRPDPADLGPQLGKNRAGVAGGLGFELPAPVTVAPGSSGAPTTAARSDRPSGRAWPTR